MFTNNITKHASPTTELDKIGNYVRDPVFKTYIVKHATTIKCMFILYYLKMF